MYIRYVYRPYHPWRHGYRREKMWKYLLVAARILLAAEAAWFGASYVRGHTVSERRPVIEQTADSGEEREIFGIGYEADSGFFFWFHSRTEDSDGN